MIYDPVLESRLEDFRGGIEYWKIAPIEEQEVIANKLHDIAYDIRSKLGPPGMAPAEMLIRIDDLFCTATDALKCSTNERAKAVAQEVSLHAEKLLAD